MSQKSFAFRAYLDSYLQVCPQLTQEELSFIESHLSYSLFQKKHFFLKCGEVQHHMGFVTKGLFRSYYIDQSGKEITISFIQEQQYAADYPSFLQQRPSNYFIECLEPAEVVTLPYIAIQQAYERFKGFENYGRKIAEKILIDKQLRLESFLFEKAEKRYLNFAHHHPSIIQRVSITHLSSFLGIERQSLTRIRKKLLNEAI